MKKLLCLLFLCLFNGNAYAANSDEDLTSQINKFRMSDEFIRHLSDCMPYKEEKTSDLGITSTYTYQIFGMIDGKCKCAFSNTSQFGTSVNNCNFTPEDLEMYTNALIRHNQKDKHSIMDIDENSLIIMGILMDEEICKMDMSEELTDYTAELRKHLSDCTSYEKKLDAFNSSISMKIYGKENGKCHYSYTTEQKPVDLTKLYPNGLPDHLKNIPQTGSLLTYDCLFSASDITLYNDSLQKTAFSMSDDDNDDNWDPEAPLNQLDDFSKKGICKIKGHFGGIHLEQ